MESAIIQNQDFVLTFFLGRHRIPNLQLTTKNIIALTYCREIRIFIIDIFYNLLKFVSNNFGIDKIGKDHKVKFEN